MNLSGEAGYLITREDDIAFWHQFFHFFWIKLIQSPGATSTSKYSNWGRSAENSGYELGSIRFMIQEEILPVWRIRRRASFCGGGL
jgi:hypothetical protein